MTIVYLAGFIGGLLLAVRIMIAGVERSRSEHPAGERSFRLSPPVVSSFALVFGLAGYIMARRQIGTVVTQIVVGGVLGVVASVIAARLVRDWWTVTPEHDTDDERYVLQGLPARSFVDESFHHRSPIACGYRAYSARVRPSRL